MPSSPLILCHPLLLLPSIPPSIRVFSSESTLRMRWPQYWSFNFSIIPSKEIPGLISCRRDWIELNNTSKLTQWTYFLHFTLQGTFLHSQVVLYRAFFFISHWAVLKVLFILLLLYYSPQYFRGSPPRIKTLHSVRNPALFYFAVPLYIYFHFEGCLSPKGLLKTPAIRFTFETQEGEEGFHNLLLNTLSAICKYYFYLYLIGQNLVTFTSSSTEGWE